MNEYRTVVFESTELNMTKRVYVYLPKEYQQSDVRYPTLYMHDGQNLFDDRTAFMNRGWRIMDLYQTYPDLPKLIIIGIESDGKTRSNHLIPYPFTYKKRTNMGGQADLYLDFVVNTVKPYIDQTFRTKPEAEYTGIMGSSFGGVNAIYAALAYPEVFSRIGCLSGAFQFDFFAPLLDRLANSDLSNIKRLYMDTGTKESDDVKQNKRYMERNDRLAQALQPRLDDSVFSYQIIKDGRHHESDWEKRFPAIVQFLFEN